MLSNDFIEEYERIEKVLISNNEEFVADRNGLLIYTTPLEKGDSIVTDVEFFQGQNIKPANVNLIIDNITLLSTNPNCQNYLPLKLRIGTKQQIDFGNPDFRVLTKYQIPSSNRLNLGSIQNKKYSEFREHALITDDLEVIVDITRYPATNTVYYITQDNDLFYQDLDTEKGATINTAQPRQPRQLYSNPEQVFYRSIQNAYYDVRDPTVTPVLIFDPNTYFTNYFHIGTFVTGQHFFTVYREDSAGGQTQIILSVQTATNYAQPSNKIISTFTNQLENSVGISQNSLFVSWDQANNQIQFAQFESGDENSVAIGSPIAVEPLSGTILGVFLGGSNLDDPSVSLFVETPTQLIWRYFSRSSPFNSTTKTWDTTLPARIRNYRNTVYFQVEDANGQSRYYFCNLDNGEFFEWRVNEIDSNTPFPKDYTIAHVDDDVFAVVSRDEVVVDNIIRTSVWSNERPINDVYSLSYTYDDRAYPYQITGNRFNFTLVLPNNAPLIDLEIFGYILDVRVRYSKRREITNATERAIGENPEQRGCLKTDRTGRCIRRDRFHKEGDVIGTTEEILGISHIKAEDFLDLYSNK